MAWTADVPQQLRLDNVLDDSAKGFNLGQAQLGAQRDTAAYNQQQSEQKSLKDIFANADMSTPEGQADALRQVWKVSPKTAEALQAQQISQKKEEAQISELQAKTEHDQQSGFDSFRDDMVKTAPSIFGTAITKAKGLPTNGPSYQAAIDEANDSIGKWSHNMRVSYQHNPKVLAMLDNIDKHDFHTVEEMQAFQQQIGAAQQMQQQKPGGEPPKTITGPNGQPVPNPAYLEFLKEEHQAKETSPAEAAAKVGAEERARLEEKRKAQQVEPAGDVSKSGEDYVKSLPSSDQPIVKGVGDYEIDPSKLSMVGGHRERIISEAKRYNPDYNQQEYGARFAAYKNFTSGKDSSSVKSFNVAISHLETLDHLTDALQSGNYKLVNHFSNIWKEETGQSAPTTFDAAKKIVADEITKGIIGASGGVADREETAKNINKDLAEKPLKDVMATYKELMGGQLTGLRKKYEETTGRKDFDRFLTSAAKKESGVKDAKAPAAAVEHLKGHPELRDEFKSKYGYLPDGV
jgi:hypothetical protein